LKLLIESISELDRLHKIRDEWNGLVNSYGQNPLLLNGFIKQFMKYNGQRGWSPLILAFSTKRKLIGIAPLRMKKKLGIKIVKFLPRNWFSPDFVIEDKYREICIREILNLLFNKLKVQFAEFVLSHDSKNLKALKKNCDELALFCSIRTSRFQWSDAYHSIILVNGGWEEFVKSRGRNFRRRFKKIEKSLNKLGVWNVKVFENGEINEAVLHDVFDIERRSWKQKWRRKKRLARDQDLFMVLNGAIETSRLDKDFKWQVWLLEVDGISISYSLVLLYKQTAYIVKTSYNEKYRKYYPGIFVNNAVVRHMFETGRIKTIDWLTKLEFHRIWTSLSLPRFRILISRKTLSIPLGYVYTSNLTRGVISMIPLTGERLERRDLHFV